MSLRNNPSGTVSGWDGDPGPAGHLIFQEACRRDSAFCSCLEQIWTFRCYRALDAYCETICSCYAMCHCMMCFLGRSKERDGHYLISTEQFPRNFFRLVKASRCFYRLITHHPASLILPLLIGFWISKDAVLERSLFMNGMTTLDSKTRNVSSFRTKSLFCMWHAGRMTLVAICTLWENGESPVVQVNLSSRTAVSLWDAMVADAYWELANEKCKRDGIALGKLRRCLDTCSSHQSSGQTGFSLSSLGQQRAFATALMGKWHCALNDSCRTVIVMMFSKSLWCEINIYIYIKCFGGSRHALPPRTNLGGLLASACRWRIHPIDHLLVQVESRTRWSWQQRAFSAQPKDSTGTLKSSKHQTSFSFCFVRIISCKFFTCVSETFCIYIYITWILARCCMRCTDWCTGVRGAWARATVVWIVKVQECTIIGKCIKA